MVNLYNWRKPWRLQREVVRASEKEPEGWSAADIFTVILETAGLNATELSAYCRERGMYPEPVKSWRQASQDANKKQVLTLKKSRRSLSWRGALRALNTSESTPYSAAQDQLLLQPPFHMTVGCLDDAVLMGHAAAVAP